METYENSNIIFSLFYPTLFIFYSISLNINDNSRCFNSIILLNPDTQKPISFSIVYNLLFGNNDFKKFKTMVDKIDRILFYTMLILFLVIGHFKLWKLYNYLQCCSLVHHNLPNLTTNLDNMNTKLPKLWWI